MSGRLYVTEYLIQLLKNWWWKMMVKMIVKNTNSIFISYNSVAIYTNAWFFWFSSYLCYSVNCEFDSVLWHYCVFSNISVHTNVLCLCLFLKLFLKTRFFIYFFIFVNKCVFSFLINFLFLWRSVFRNNLLLPYLNRWKLFSWIKIKI